MPSMRCSSAAVCGRAMARAISTLSLAIHCRGRLDAEYLPVRGQGLFNGSDFRASGRCAGIEHDGALIQHQRHIFHENRVWQIRFGIQGDDIQSQGSQCIFVLFMLDTGAVVIDRFAREVGEFTLVDSRADLAGDGNFHGVLLTATRSM